MSVIKKPSQIESKRTLVALVYGQPGIGKTTLACSAPGAVLLDFDGGVSRVRGEHQVPTVQVSSWDDAVEAVTEIEQSPQYRTIVIDTVGKMLGFMDDKIMTDNPRMRQPDGSLTLKGYGVRKKMFAEFNERIRRSGRHIVYVAHQSERREERNRKEVTIIRPEISGSALNDLMKEMDMVGYMYAEDGDRSITFDANDNFYTKNSSDLRGAQRIPQLVDADGNSAGINNYFGYVIASYLRRQSNNRELNARRDALTAEIRERATAIDSAAKANEYVEWVKGLDHVADTNLAARNALAAKVNSLGLVYDKKNNAYTDGQA